MSIESRSRARVTTGLLLGVLALVAAMPRATAETATIAVASNFIAPFEKLARDFAAAEPHSVVMVSGSTGQLYAQIVNGAPFDALLAADQEYTARLAAEGQAIAASQFTYAVGRLALFTREVERFAPLSVATLARDDYRWLAIATPEVAPYGQAAKETLMALALWERVGPRLVQGQNIAQTFAMAETRNAELGLVALSQAIVYDGAAAYIEIPSSYHEPLRQDAILLRRGADNAAATAFLVYLRGAAAHSTIASFGYGSESASDNGGRSPASPPPSRPR